MEFTDQAFIGDTVPIKVVTGAIGDVALVKYSIRVAICEKLAFIRKSIAIAVVTYAIGGVAFVRNAIAVAVLAGAVGNIIKVADTIIIAVDYIRYTK